jgi:hypothetical protein
MEQAIINVEGTSTIETAAAAKKLIETFGSQNIRAISVKRVNENSNEVVVELDFVPGLAQHLHGFTMQVNGLTAGYDGPGPPPIKSTSLRLRRHRSLKPVRSPAGGWRKRNAGNA